MHVKDQNENPIGGAAVTVTVTRPNGRISTVSGHTDIYGLVSFQYKVSKGGLLGAYGVTALAIASGYSSASATGAFKVS